MPSLAWVKCKELLLGLTVTRGDLCKSTQLTVQCHSNERLNCIDSCFLAHRISPWNILLGLLPVGNLHVKSSNYFYILFFTLITSFTWYCICHINPYVWKIPKWKINSKSQVLHTLVKGWFHEQIHELFHLQLDAFNGQVHEFLVCSWMQYNSIILTAFVMTNCSWLHDWKF